MNLHKQKLLEETEEEITKAEDVLACASRFREWVEDMPEACRCDPRDWGGPVGKICDEYRPGVDSLCKKCEHDKECHTC
ncbi:MAG: hypothetical protein DRP01_00045 [Archaeoglobales archaeon]|nr:MAG: hypothetical protein DRP01_00045 [Archaeoglobales archaeon]